MKVTRPIETSVRVSVLPPIAGEAKISLDGFASDRQIEMVPLKRLKKSRRNARTHSKKQIGQISNSIVRFGFITPIVVDQHDRIVAGYGRAEAAESIGLKIVPVIRLMDLSDTELRAYMLADNQIALNAGWDRELLAVDPQRGASE
jgi:ParB-like chromosome segregation protein Spo0J